MTQPTARQHSDPWAHQRAEPRTLALFWLIYLFISVIGGVLWIARSAMVVSGYAPAARIMLVVVAVGIVVLWPMVRLSQASPRSDRSPGAPGGPLSAALADLFVILFPVQVIVWPLSLLSGWPPDVAAAMAALLASWSLVAGAVVALGTGGAAVDRPRQRGLAQRTAWMIVMLVLVLGVPVAGHLMQSRGAAPPAWLATCSPLSGVYAVTGRGFSGAPSPVSPQQWLAIGGAGAAGVLGLLAAGIRRG